MSHPEASRTAPTKRRVPPATWFWLILAGLVAYLAPAAPVLLRYGAIPKAPDRTRTFLVAGVTPRYSGHHTRAPEDFTGLADTIVLVQVRATTREVRMLNIPRDTWTRVPGWGMAKINSSIAHGGPETLMRTVADLTGIRPEGYVLLSLDALRDVTDAAGGVTVNVAQRMKYTDEAAKLYIDFQPGRQHLSGTQAEAYVRFRHDALGDIGRVKRQQEFMQALGARLTGPLGIVYGPRVIGALGRNTRSNLDREDTAELLGAMLRRPRLVTHLLPGNFGGAGTWAVDRAGLRELVARDFTPEVQPGDPRLLRIAVVNVAAPQGSARRLKAQLEALGYRNVIAMNGEGDETRTVVLASDRTAASRVARDVGYGRVVLGGVGEPGVDITVRLGADTPESATN